MQRRQKTRAHLFFPVLLHAEGSDRVFEFCGTDFSSSGLFLLMKNPPAVGSSLKLEFDLSPLGGRLAVTARVVRTVTGQTEPDVGKWGAGLEFEDLSENDRNVVQEWVTKVAPTKTPEGAPEASGQTPSELEVRIRLEGFDYLTRHQDVKMTRQGLFIGTKAPLPTGARVDIELCPVGEEKVYVAKGQVMHIVTVRLAETSGTEPGMTVRILQCNDEARHYLQALLEEAIKDEEG
jgi:hypothetical protein